MMPEIIPDPEHWGTPPDLATVQAERIKRLEQRIAELENALYAEQQHNEEIAAAMTREQAERDELVAALLPFALAAEDEDVREELPGVNLLTENRMLCIYAERGDFAHDDESRFLKVRHLRAARDVLNGKSE